MAANATALSAAPFRQLLRRVVLSDPEWIVARAMETIPNLHPDIQRAMAVHGPLLGLVSLREQFTSGYREHRSESRVREEEYWSGFHNLVTAISNRAQVARRRVENSIIQARADNAIFEALDPKRKRHGYRDVLPSLLALYDIPPPLGRLTDLIEHYQSMGGSFEGCAVIAHQHLLGSTVSQFQALWSLGLRRDWTYVSGKPYSTNRLAALALEQNGCQVRTGFEGFGIEDVMSPAWYQNLHYDDVRLFVVNSLVSARNAGCEGVIILDDGGLLLRAFVELRQIVLEGRFTSSTLDRSTSTLNSLESCLRHCRFAGVEQTTFGRRYVESVLGTQSGVGATAHRPPTIPIVSVARSRLKIERESEMIAASVISEVRSFLAASDKDAQSGNIGGATVGIVGFGAVGAWVCRELLREPDRYRAPSGILVFDDDTAKTSIARSFNYGVAQSVEEVLRRADIVIGCTGDASGIDIRAATTSGGVVLASASSGNHEFARLFSERPGLKKGLNPDLTPFRNATSFDWLHSIFELDVKGRPVVLLNAGFPVNFTGGVDPIEARKIELTRCLMVAGAVAARGALLGGAGRANSGGPLELVDLDEGVLRELFEAEM